jgi:hypothetical protein
MRNKAFAITSANLLHSHHLSPPANPNDSKTLVIHEQELMELELKTISGYARFKLGMTRIQEMLSADFPNRIFKTDPLKRVKRAHDRHFGPDRQFRMTSCKRVNG